MTRILYILMFSVLTAYLLVMFGSDDWLERMTDRLFYVDWLLGTIAAFLVYSYFDFAQRWLGKHYPWFDGWASRLWRQLVVLLVVPSVLAILMTYLLNTFVYDQNFRETGYFQNEFLVTVLVIGVVNLGYIILDLIQYSRERPVIQEPAAERVATLSESHVFIGQRGAQQVPVTIEDMAYVWLDSRVIFVKTFEDETLMLSDNLDFFENLLPTQDFFRANRQTIVHRKSCASFKPIENGKIRLALNPESERPVTVSQKKAAKFREWIRS